MRLLLLAAASRGRGENCDLRYLSMVFALRHSLQRLSPMKSMGYKTASEGGLGAPWVRSGRRGCLVAVA